VRGYRRATRENGSADIYFGPEAPEDENANWIQTISGRGYFRGFRLYSPAQVYFDGARSPTISRR
jgi:hypothetical protein